MAYNLRLSDLWNGCWSMHNVKIFHSYPRMLKALLDFKFRVTDSCQRWSYATAEDNAQTLEFQKIKAHKSLFKLTPRLKLLSVHWSEDGFSQAVCIDGLDSQKAGKRKGKETEGRLVQTTKS